MTSRELGIPPGDLDDDDLFRELGHLYETRLDALRHAADQAYGEHTRRMNELEAEYLRRRPAGRSTPSGSGRGPAPAEATSGPRVPRKFVCVR